MDSSLPRGLAVDVREGESIVFTPSIDGRVVITVEQKSGRLARLRLQSEGPIAVSRIGREKGPRSG